MSDPDQPRWRPTPAAGGEGGSGTGAVKLGALQPGAPQAPAETVTPAPLPETSPPLRVDPAPAPDPEPPVPKTPVHHAETIRPATRQQPVAAPQPEPAPEPAPIPAAPASSAPVAAAPVAAAPVSTSYAPAADPLAEPVRPVAAQPVRAAPEPPYRGPLPPPPYKSGAREGFRPSRGLMIGAGAAALIGIIGALVFRPGFDRDEPERPVTTAASDEAQGADPAAGIDASREAYQPPDREAVRQAYARAAEVFQTQGASGLARFGQQCFASLERRATYRDLDFCLAFDAYGAAITQRAAGGQAPGADSYFGQTEARHVRVAEAVMGGEGDASARLIDIRRLAIEVARETGPLRPVQAAAPRPAQPAAEGAQPGQPAPPPSEVYAQAPEVGAPVAQRPPAIAVPRPTPAQQPARAPAAPAPRVAEAPSMPTAEEVAASRPAGRGPSYNCRYARSRSERLVCQDPNLAALDRRLNAAFEDAIAAGADRRDLRSEQDQWLAVREAAAPDADAVADAYRRRIRELNSPR